MPGTFEILRRIQRDLDIHSQAIVSIYSKLLEENPTIASPELKEYILKMTRDLTNLETDFTQFLSEGMIPGLNNLMIAKFSQAQANKVLKILSMEPLFPGVGG
ncbi:ribonucleotide-diphosphate reductase subunit beta, partial [mine drainage metagenome]